MSDKIIQEATDAGLALFEPIFQSASGFAPAGNAPRKYIEGLVSEYNNVKILGMREPVPLKSLYVRANILEKIRARMGMTSTELQDFFDFDKRNFGKKHKTVDGEAIVNKLQKFIVLGKPGAGKTTYLKFLTLMMLDPKSKIKKRKLPIFITLRQWADTGMPLEKYLIKQFEDCSFPQAALWAQHLLLQGYCLILLDGLDEVSQEANQNKVIEEIIGLSKRYGENQYVISCRVAAYNHWFEQFTDVEMADFEKPQIEAFIQNWFKSEPETGAKCWERIQGNKQLLELATTPLLLTLLCLEFSERFDFPQNRAELYKNAIETLLSKWDGSRRIKRSEAYQHLGLKRKESMFSRIAYATFRDNKYFIQERMVTKMIEKYIENLPGFDASQLEPDSRAVLKTIEANHGIFVERARDVYSFAHLTFQEYFTAQYIVDNQFKQIDRDGNIIESGEETLLTFVVRQYALDPKWKEIFLMVSGMLDGADELLLLLQGQANECLQDESLRDLIEVCNQAVLDVSNPYPLVIRKGFAIYLALNDRFAFDLAINLALALERIYNLEINSATYFDHTFDLDYSLLSGMVNAKGYEMKFIEKYLYINTLIINCLNAGCYIEKETRDRIFRDMFAPKP